MVRKDGQAGRKRYRPIASDGGAGLSAAAGLAAGVVFALLWVLLQPIDGWAGSAAVAPTARADATGAAPNEPSQAAGAAQVVVAAAQPEPRPLNFSSAADVAGAVMSSAKAAADEVDRLMDVDSLPHLFLSYGNAAYFQFVHNWALSVQQIGAPYVIGSFDTAMAGLCTNHSLVCVLAQFATADDFRTNFAAFRAMGAVKVQLVLEILERHPRLPLLVVSDSDTVWLRQPWPYFEQRPDADFFISSDCNSVDMEDEWPPNGKPGCGHIPGKNWGIAFNTGLFAARNRPATRRLLAAWVELLTNPAKEKDKYGRGMEDQLALNVLFTDDGRMDEQGAQAVSQDEPRLIRAFNGTLRLQTLPVALFSGGHVAFVQRTPWRRGVVPIVIHATFQRWWSDGKRERLREFGLWHTDGPEYYGAAPAGPAGSALKFLTYENNVVPWVEEVAARRYAGREAPLFYKMWLGMSYQLAAFRDALAAARMLGRALVMPTLWCWCDYAEWPDVLLTCLYPGADYEAPFQCPLDFMLDVQSLDSQDIQYRTAGFLDLPQVPAHVKHSRAVVRVAEAAPAEPFPRPDNLTGLAVAAWPGIAQEEVGRVVQPVEEAAVLELRGFLPGFLGPWQDEPARDTFDRQWEEAVREARWCCATWGNSNQAYSTIRYALPRPFKDGWQPWKTPKLAVPDWCDKVTDQDGNKRFVSHPQHPCKFLRDPATAPLDDDG